MKKHQFQTFEMMSRLAFTYLLLLSLSLWSCRKDVEEFRPYAPSAAAIGALLEESVPNPSTQTKFVLQFLSEDKVLETPNGTRVFLIDTDHLFANEASGQTVLCSTCAELTVEVTEVFDKSDIIARGLNTIGSGNVLLETQCMVRVKVSCGGQVLALLPDRSLKVQLPKTGAAAGNFVFNWREGNGGPGYWVSNGQEAFQAEWPVSGLTQNGYELLIKNLGWAACGQQISDTPTAFCTTLPSGFADQNTLTYIVFEDKQVVVPLEYDDSNQTFCFPAMPVGYPVQVIALSKLGTQYWLGKAATEIGSNQAAAFPLGAQQSNEQAVVDFVKGL